MTKAQFITLTPVSTAGDLRAKVAHIVRYRPNSSGALIVMSDGYNIVVKETPEEIDAMLDIEHAPAGDHDHEARALLAEVASAVNAACETLPGHDANCRCGAHRRSRLALQKAQDFLAGGRA